MTEVEWVDAVDHEDRLLHTIPRAQLRDGGLNFRVIHVLVINTRGELLVQRVHPDKAKGFTFGSSVAGHVQAGEAYEAAARREFLEELGAEPAGLRSAGKTWLDTEGRRKFIGVFVSRMDGPFQPDALEVESLEWLSLPEARRRMRRDSESFSPTFLRVFRHVENEDAWPR